jgi:hypothetical protein
LAALEWMKLWVMGGAPAICSTHSFQWIFHFHSLIPASSILPQRSQSRSINYIYSLFV